MRQFKGVIKHPFLKKLLNSNDYVKHDNINGVYTVVMRKNTFEIVKVSTKYYRVFLVR